MTDQKGGGCFMMSNSNIMNKTGNFDRLIEFWNKKCKIGPFSLMHTWMQNQSEVVILTRNLNSLRSIVIGKLIAFDKHWNLIIQIVGSIK